MKKILLFSLLTAVFLACSLDVDAQYRKKKKKKKKSDKTEEYFEDGGNFASRLWYGGGVNLGFNGFNGSSAFNLGLSPMVGYKIIDPFSVGLRTEIDYFYQKIITGGDNIKYESLSWGAGAFTRFKFWQLFFHGEFMYENVARPYDEDGRGPFLDPDNLNRIQSFRFTDNKLNLGLGYNSGGLLAYEIYFLYDALSKLEDNTNPWDIRLGFTYQF